MNLPTTVRRRAPMLLVLIGVLGVAAVLYISEVNPAASQSPQLIERMKIGGQIANHGQELLPAAISSRTCVRRQQELNNGSGCRGAIVRPHVDRAQHEHMISRVGRRFVSIPEASACSTSASPSASLSSASGSTTALPACGSTRFRSVRTSAFGAPCRCARDSSCARSCSGGAS